MPPPLFHQVVREASGCLGYLLGDPATREAIAVDPPQELDLVTQPAERLGVRIVAVADTHTHADHRSGARRLAQATGARLLMPAKSGAAFAHEAMRGGRDVRVGDLRLRALDTPGHTPDAMTLVLDDRALVGDTLLVGTAGRADFYDRGPEELYHSLFDTLLKLGDELTIYPAHFGGHHGLPPERMTTLGHERRVNEALNQRTKEDFVRYMTEGWPPQPKGWRGIMDENTRG